MMSGNPKARFVFFPEGEELRILTRTLFRWTRRGERTDSRTDFEVGRLLQRWKAGICMLRFSFDSFRFTFMGIEKLSSSRRQRLSIATSKWTKTAFNRWIGVEWTACWVKEPVEPTSRNCKTVSQRQQLTRAGDRTNELNQSRLLFQTVH